jgi:hypothetical protein
MKELHGRASGVVSASVEDCLALFEAVDRYPIWYPDVVPEADVLERDDQGRPTVARANLHVSAGPLVRDFGLRLAVSRLPPATVRLKRIPHDRSDPEEFQVTWHVDEGQETRIRLELDANLSVPRLVPLGGIGESMAQGFVSAAIRALGA